MFLRLKRQSWHKNHFDSNVLSLLQQSLTEQLPPETSLHNRKWRSCYYFILPTSVISFPAMLPSTLMLKHLQTNVTLAGTFVSWLCASWILTCTNSHFNTDEKTGGRVAGLQSHLNNGCILKLSVLEGMRLPHNTFKPLPPTHIVCSQEEWSINPTQIPLLYTNL